MRNERLLQLAGLQVQYERIIDRADPSVTHTEKMQLLTHLCAEFNCSFKEFQYMERCLMHDSVVPDEIPLFAGTKEQLNSLGK
jgi:hypothetical protein